MNDKDKPPVLSEEHIAAARQALAQPGFDEALADLPPELRAIVEQAKGALGSDDPSAAFEQLAAAAAQSSGIAPEAVQDALGKAMAEAMAGLAGAEAAVKAAEEMLKDVETHDAGAVIERIFDRLMSLELRALVGPVLGDVRKLEQDLLALPAKVGPGADTDEVRRHVTAVEDRALRLEAAAAELGGSDLLHELAGALHEAEGLIEAVGVGSSSVALIRGALLAGSGDRRSSQEAFAHALEQAEKHDAVDVGATAATALQLDALQRGDLQRALDIAGRVSVLATRTGELRRATLSRYDQGLLMARMGKQAEGEPIVKAALDEARTLERPELVARGLVVLGKIRENAGDADGGMRLYEEVLGQEGQPGVDAEVAQAAMGMLRVLPTDDLVDATRLRCLGIVREHSRRISDADTFGQTSLLLAESEEARGDRLAALRVILEGRDAMRAAPGCNPEPLDRALRQLRSEWGSEVYDAFLEKLAHPPPNPTGEA